MRFSLPPVATGITLVLSTFACSAATPEIIWCHNCTSEQTENAVLNDPVGIGTSIYIGDTVSRTARAYEVYATIDDSQHPPKRIREVADAPADSELVTALLGAIDFYNFIPVGWEKQIDLDYNGPDPTASGFSTANAGDAQDHFNTWMNSTYSGARGLTVLYGYALSVASAAHLVDANTAPQATITTKFSDESKITATYNLATHKLEADPNTAKDGESNPIPYLDDDGHAHKLGGVRHFNDDYQGTLDYNGWLRQISHFPVTIRTPSGTTIGGGDVSSGNDVKPVICVETTDEGGKKVETCFAG